MSKFPSEEQDRFIVRMPDGLRGRIRAAADANNRSMNAEIVYRLEESLANEAAAQINPRDGYWEMPDGVSAEDISSAIEEANRVAVSMALKKLGVELRPLKVPGRSNE